jgi:tetratricopeptide (TPR) repeat protein
MVLANVLVRRDPAQARLEYRLAFEQAAFLTGYASATLPTLVSGYYDAMEIVPGGPAGPQALEILVDAVDHRLPATRDRLDHELSARVPRALGPVVRAATAAVADISPQDPAPWCADDARVACVDAARTLARKVEQLEPGKCTGFILESRILLAEGKADAALDALQHAADSVADRNECLKALVELATSARREGRAVATLDAMVRFGCADESECADRLTWVAQTEQAHGHTLKALTTYKLVYEKTSSDGVLAQMASLAATLGLHVEAMDDYERLAARAPDQSEWELAAQRERDEISKLKAHPAVSPP